MPSCAHCGTEFSPATDDERYCCRGCEYVSKLITEQGFERFYELKEGSVVAPVKSRPFEKHDFSWLEERVAKAEQEAGERRTAAKLDLGIEGISCVGCVWLIERLFFRHEGGLRCNANPANGRLHLEWKPGAHDIGAFLDEIRSFGYIATENPGKAGEGERGSLGARLGLCGAFALNTMAFSLPTYLDMPDNFEFAGLFQLIAFLSATLSMLVGAGYFMDRAWRALRVGTVHIDLPIALGLIAAYFASIAGWIMVQRNLIYFDFVSTFVFLMLAGRYGQTMAIDRNRKRLLRAQPIPSKMPLADEPSTFVETGELKPGVTFLLEAGQALPVASMLAGDARDFSLEWIRGESEPVSFQTGSHIPAGAILLSQSSARIEASESWEDSLLARLIAPHDEADRNPHLDRLLRRYIIVVLIVGIGGFAAWAAAGSALTGFQAMISVFVVSCPCALGVAIPLADQMAAGRIERLGVFIRNGTLWARLMRVRQVIFDKTGTLTLERPRLANPEALAQLDDPAALALAVLTRNSLHPVARTLLEALGMRGQTLLSGIDLPALVETPGCGVTVSLADGIWSLGRIGWNPDDESKAAASSPGSELRHNGRLIATFHFEESLRSGVPEVLAFLKQSHRTVRVLSGDHPDKVRDLAAALGIEPDRAIGAMSPQEKADAVNALNLDDVLYLGDGANDSLAFDHAAVTGTPVVDRSLLESKADFYTLGDGLGFLPELFHTAQRRAEATRAAFGFAIIYNLAVVAVALAGHMNPLLGAVLMPTSSVISLALVVAVFSRKK